MENIQPKLQRLDIWTEDVQAWQEDGLAPKELDQLILLLFHWSMGMDVTEEKKEYSTAVRVLFTDLSKKLVGQEAKRNKRAAAGRKGGLSKKKAD